MAAYNPPGTLQLSSVPGNLNFGRDLIVHQENQLFPLVSLDQPLSVTDQRYVTKQWSLTLTQTQALKNGDGDELTDAIKYKKNDELLPVSNAAIEIETRRNSDNDPYVVSNQWNSDQGLMLQVSPSEAKAGAYNGEITWNLSDVPDETEE
nr:WxL domain-containing protein [Furfurilactobacillus milii]